VGKEPVFFSPAAIGTSQKVSGRPISGQRRYRQHRRGLRQAEKSRMASLARWSARGNPRKGDWCARRPVPAGLTARSVARHRFERLNRECRA